MMGFVTIEYQDEIIDVRFFNNKHRMDQVLTIWKKRYAKLYYKANVYITLQTKMNKLNYDY